MCVKFKSKNLIENGFQIDSHAQQFDQWELSYKHYSITYY